jgi:tripartite-type tricarboxylate transporter receptor subunit TctC
MARWQLIVALLAAAAAATFASLPASAEEYPSRPVKIIVPFGPGGPADVFARAVAAELQKSMNQTFVMENRPGAGTTIGTDAVAKSAPDGYTLLVVSGTQTVNETLYGKKQYKLMRDLAPIAPMVDTDLVMVVHPSVPAKSLSELVALAKAKPGTLNYGSSGIGSNYHMAGELLKTLTGADIVHIPYKGSTGARNDILSGQVQILFDSVPTMKETIKGGLVRAIGTTGIKRDAQLPDVPTLDESGAKGFQHTLWLGIMAPAGTPQPIVDRLNKETTKAVNQASFKEALVKQGAVPLSMSPAEFKAFVEAQVDKWAKVIQANKIKPIN